MVEGTETEEGEDGVGRQSATERQSVITTATRSSRVPFVIVTYVHEKRSDEIVIRWLNWPSITCTAKRPSEENESQLHSCIEIRVCFDSC